MLPLRQNRDLILRPPSNKPPPPPPFRISAPILMRVQVRINRQWTEVHLHLIAHKRTVFPHYKNSGLISLWVHKVFKRMISFSNFVAITRLVVLARKDPWSTSSFFSLLDPLPWIALCSHYELFFKKSEYKEGKFHQQMPNKFQLTLTEHSLSVFVTITVSNVVRFK